jgi:hypothetical protein
MASSGWPVGAARAPPTSPWSWKRRRSPAWWARPGCSRPTRPSAPSAPWTKPAWSTRSPSSISSRPRRSPSCSVAGAGGWTGARRSASGWPPSARTTSMPGGCRPPPRTPGRPARPRAATLGREPRAPRAAHPRGRGRARHVARGVRHGDARGAAARSAQRHARARGARGVPARAHGARAASALPPDGARPAGAHAARSHRLLRPRPPRPRRLPTAAGRPRPPTRPHPSEGAHGPC